MDIFFFPSLSVFVFFIFDDTSENEKNKVQVVGGNYALVGKLFDQCGIELWSVELSGVWEDYMLGIACVNVRTC